MLHDSSSDIPLSLLFYNSFTYEVKKIFNKIMSPEIPWIKLPNTASGFFLLLHTGLLFFWLFNKSDSTISILLPISISGLVVGFIMHYFVGPYLPREHDEFVSLKPVIICWIIAIFVYYILYLNILGYVQPPLANGWMQ